VQTGVVVLDRDRRALQALAVQFFVNGAVWATLVSRLPAVRDRVGITVGVLGAVLMIGNLSSLAGSFFTARLLAKVSSRWVMVIGGGFYVAALPVVGVSRSPVVLIGALVVLMWFDVFIDVAMNYQASVVSARREMPVMNRLAGLWSLGTVSGGLVSLGVAQADTDPAVHFSAASLVLLVALAVVSSRLLPVDEPHPEQVVKSPRSRNGLRFAAATIALGFASAMAVTLDVTSSDWATFRLTDDLGGSPGTAVAAFVAFTAGMTSGRLGGDAVLVRVGSVRLTQLGAATCGIGLGLATLLAARWIALVGFTIAGLGASVLAPQLADTAARAPGPVGSGFKTLFVGHRAAAFVVPFVIGNLANSNRFSVGTAMAIVGIPTAAALVVTARTAITGKPSSQNLSPRTR
jgi:Major Facilitator Superfamily